MKPIIKQLLFLFLLNLALSFLIKGITNYYEIPNNKMALDHAIWIFTDEIGDDSWRPMKLAYDHWTESQGQSLLYTDLLLTHKVKFQYPPTALLTHTIYCNKQYLPFEFYNRHYIYLPVPHDRKRDRTNALFPTGNTKRHSFPLTEKIIVGALLTFLLFTFYPAVKAGTLGQIQVWLNAIFCTCDPVLYHWL